MTARLCQVSAGKFIMGREPELVSTQESPPRYIDLDEYFIDETPVTWGQYKIFLDWIRITNDHSKCHPEEPTKKDHRPWVKSNPELYFQLDQPVIGLDWFDMYAFAAWASMRLPTEAEWEKAARGVDGRRWPWGDETGLQNGKLQALYDDTGFYFENPCLAGVYDHPNGVSPYGCLDMAGNVWEVCQDFYDKNWYQNMPKKNPINKLKSNMVVMRGGSWLYNEHDAMCALRAGILRHGRSPEPIVGFRCASDIPNPIGTIGPMRHLKLQNEIAPPDNSWTTIVHENGEAFYDGDDVGESGLYIGSGSRATLNDFYLLMSAAPPLEWKKQFTDIDIRSDLRDSGWITLSNHFELAGREYPATGSKGASRMLESWARPFIDGLVKISSLECLINIRPEPLSNLNGYTKFDKDNEYIIGIHAGIVNIHAILGYVLSMWISAENKNQVLDFDYLQGTLSGLYKYVWDGGEKIVLSEFNVRIEDLHKTLNGFMLSDFMSVMILSHEIAHIKLGHTSEKDNLNTEARWRREFDADKLGLSFAIQADKTKEWESGFAIAIGFWAQFLNNCDQNKSGTSTHPPMKERIEKIKQNFPIEFREYFNFGVQAMNFLAP